MSVTAPAGRPIEGRPNREAWGADAIGESAIDVLAGTGGAARAPRRESSSGASTGLIIRPPDPERDLLTRNTSQTGITDHSFNTRRERSMTLRYHPLD